jgi:hypothetical protein
LVNQQLFGGTILAIVSDPNFANPSNLSNTTLAPDYDDDDKDDRALSRQIHLRKSNMAEANSAQEQLPTRTTYTTVTYTTLDKGLSITISETITITNTNVTNDALPTSNKNYEVILVPTIDQTKSTTVHPNTATHEKVQLPPIATATITTRSMSQQNLLRAIKPLGHTDFAYIDESSDDHTLSSVDGRNTCRLSRVNVIVVRSIDARLLNSFSSSCFHAGGRDYS